MRFRKDAKNNYLMLRAETGAEEMLLSMIGNWLKDKDGASLEFRGKKDNSLYILDIERVHAPFAPPQLKTNVYDIFTKKGIEVGEV